MFNLFWEMGLEMALHSFVSLLAKASHKASADLRGGEKDSTSWWEELQSQDKGHI